MTAASGGRHGRWQAPDERLPVTIELNGSSVTLEAEPRRTLADTLRERGWTGTHLGCEHGVCGSCTVLLDGEPARACLMLAVQAAGRRVQTVEGLANVDGLNPLQQAFDAGGALQCGFCTPGFLMLATAVLRDQPDADEAGVRERLSANICRCTGGVPVVEAVLAAQRAMKDTAR